MWGRKDSLRISIIIYHCKPVILKNSWFATPFIGCDTSWNLLRTHAFNVDRSLVHLRPGDIVMQQVRAVRSTVSNSTTGNCRWKTKKQGIIVNSLHSGRCNDKSRSVSREKKHLMYIRVESSTVNVKPRSPSDTKKRPRRMRQQTLKGIKRDRMLWVCQWSQQDDQASYNHDQRKAVKTGYLLKLTALNH